MRPTPTPHRHLDRLQHEAVGESVAYGTPYCASGSATAAWSSPMLPGQSGRSSRRSSAGGRGRPRAAARRCRTPASPPTRRAAASASRGSGAGSPPASGTGAWSTASPCRAHATSCRSEPMPSLDDRPVGRFGAEPCDREEGEPDQADDRDRVDGPVRDLRGEQHADDEERRGERDRRADGRRRSRSAWRSSRGVRRGGAGASRDAGELAEPPGSDRVREQTDPERREHVVESRLVLVRQRLTDRQPPRQRPDEHRDDVQEKREDDPAPDDQRNASSTLPQSGPRHQITTNARTSATSATTTWPNPTSSTRRTASCRSSLLDGRCPPRS